MFSLCKAQYSPPCTEPWPFLVTADGQYWRPVQIYYRPQRSWAKVMFLQAFVILSTGGGMVCLSACWDTTPLEQTPPEQIPPGADTPWADTPQSRHPLSRHPSTLEQTPPRLSAPPTPLGLSTSPPQTKCTPPGSRLWHMVNERPIRIVLECILVYLRIPLLVTSVQMCSLKHPPQLTTGSHWKNIYGQHKLIVIECLLELNCIFSLYKTAATIQFC